MCSFEVFRITILGLFWIELWVQFGFVLGCSFWVVSGCVLGAVWRCFGLQFWVWWLAWWRRCRGGFCMLGRRGLWWTWYHGGVAVRGAAIGGAGGTIEMVVWYCGGRMMARNP